MDRYESAAKAMRGIIPQAYGADVETTNRVATMREAASALLQASAEINDLREAIKAALQIRDLWGAPNEEINDEHHEEYVALAAMESRFRRVLCEKPEGSMFV